MLGRTIRRRSRGGLLPRKRCCGRIELEIRYWFRKRTGLATAVTLAAAVMSVVVLWGSWKLWSHIRTPAAERVVVLREGGYEWSGVKREASVLANRKRQAQVREVFERAWRAYVQNGYGHDEIECLTNRPSDDLGGLGASLVGSLDTLAVMGLDADLAAARKHVELINWNVDREVPVLPTVSNVVGGLLGAYTLTEDVLYLDKAKELLDRLLPAFHDHHVPAHNVHLASGRASGSKEHPYTIGLDERAGVQLELAAASHLIGNPEYTRVGFAALDGLRIRTNELLPGLFPLRFHTQSGNPGSERVSVGVGGSRAYATFAKYTVYDSWSEAGKVTAELHDRAVSGVVDKLVRQSEPSNMTYIGRWSKGFESTFEQPACVYAATLALGAKTRSEVSLAHSLLETCTNLFKDQSTSLGPDIVRFNLRSNVGAAHPDYAIVDARYKLRGDVAEALFVLYRLTGDETYRHIAWDLFVAIRSQCATAEAYGGLADVTSVLNRRHTGNMNVEFLSRTLKYMYLLFGAPTELPLSEYVFSSGGHPFKRM